MKEVKRRRRELMRMVRWMKDVDGGDIEVEVTK
jgi:hypothetical protein